MAPGIEEHVFITGPNMGKQWMTTHEHILAWATSTYGNNVKKSLLNLKQTVVVDTKPPTNYTKEQYEQLMTMQTQTWLMEFKAHQYVSIKLTENLGKFYAILFSDCNPAIQNKLQSMAKFYEINSSGDSIGLLQLIDIVLCSFTDGSKYKYLQAFFSMKRLLNFKQKPSVTTANY